jgi:hypothetical protein
LANIGTPIAFDNGQLAAFSAPDATAFSPQLWVADGTGRARRNSR